MANIKIHKADCTAAEETPALAEFKALWPKFCPDCRATGIVNRSGMSLPCGYCMNGRYKCPRCARPSASEGATWNKVVDCKFCGWRGPDDGAPVADCDCPIRVEIEKITPLPNKSQAIRDKRSRLEALAGVTSAADNEPLDKNRPKKNRWRSDVEDGRNERDYENRVSEDS